MDAEAKSGGSRSLVLRESSTTSSSCTICSLTPPLNPITSTHGEVFCLSCLRYALIEKHQDGQQEPAIQDSESRQKGCLDVDNAADDIDVENLVQKALSETRREQIKELQQLEENLEQLKTTLVCALGLLTLKDRAWLDEAIAKERLETRREIAWLESRTLGLL